MICTTIQYKTLDEIYDILASGEIEMEIGRAHV